MWNFITASNMSERRYTEGNLIVLYAIYRLKSAGVSLPNHILERVKVCLDVLKIIMHSKPDKHKTTVLVVANEKSAGLVKDALLGGGVDQKIILLDSRSNSIDQTFNQVRDIVVSRVNPFYVYFIASFWQRDIYEYVIGSKLKGYAVQFEGARDQRSVQEVEEERAFEAPKKNPGYYKKKAKDKGIDLLLSYIFRKK